MSIQRIVTIMLFEAKGARRRTGRTKKLVWGGENGYECDAYK